MNFEQLLTYLAGLGTRHAEIGNAEISFDGQASGNTRYPLVLVEGDALREGKTPGLDCYTLAVQVLDLPARAGVEPAPTTLARCAKWADELVQQFRDEEPGLLEGEPSALALVGNAGTDLATGWRVELKIKLPKNLDRNAVAAKFSPRLN